MANEDKRIIEQPASESILNDDWIAKDSASEGTTKIQLSLLKQLFGGNNFAGEWHSGTVYNKEAYVTHEGKLYHNIKGGSVVAVDWSSSQWEQVSIGNELRKIVESLAPTFDTNTNYKVDDLVIYDNTLYRCIAAHTAGTWVGSHFGTVKVSSLLLYGIMDNFTEIFWENYSGSPVNYTKGTVIHKGLTLYRCKADTTNQSWDSSKWEQVDVTDLINSVTVLIETVLSNIAPTFSSLAQYNINDFVIYNNELYICMKPHHGSWDPLDFGTGKIGDMLKGIFNNIADVYNPSGSYVKGDVVNYVGIPLRCIVDTATSPMVFSEWEQVTVEQLIDEKVTDVQIAGQTTTDENKISDLTSLAIEGTASGEIASFSDGSNLPMRSFICNIDAVQDLHGYDYPWVGGAGKNKFDKTRFTQGYSINQNSPYNTYPTENWSLADYIEIIGGATYTATVDDNETTNTTYVFYDADKNPIVGGSGRVITAPQNAKYIRFDFKINKEAYVQFELGSTATAYEPYSNICPISGHTEVNVWVRGKNLFDKTSTTQNYRVITLNGELEYSSGAYASDYTSVTPNTTYTMNFVYYSVANFGMAYYDANKVYISGEKQRTQEGDTSFTFTTPSNCKYIRFTIGSDVSIDNVQLEKGSIATTYTPYNPNSQTIQVSWQTEAGEVYGGYVDLVSGVLTVTHKSQTGFTRGSQDSSNKLYKIGAISDMKSSNNVNITDNYFEPLNLNDARASETPSITQYGTNLYVGGYIGKETELDTLLESLQVVYELATPITYQLTPTQIKSLKDDITNAWCSTGDVNTKYNKDATTVINSLIARIEALENA